MAKKSIFRAVTAGLRKVGRALGFKGNPLVEAGDAVEKAADALGDNIEEVAQELEDALEDFINKPFKPFADDKAARRAKQKKLASKRKQLQARRKREEISRKRAIKLPTVHETAAHVVRQHHVTSSSQKLRVMRRVRYMSEEQRREAVMMNSAQLADAARDQYPDQENGKGERVNPFWYH